MTNMTRDSCECCRLAAELEGDELLQGLTAEEVQQAASVEADSAQELQHKMEALQAEVHTVLTQLQNRSQQSAKDHLSASRLQVTATIAHSVSVFDPCKLQTFNL